MRLIRVLFTFKNNAGPTDLRTDVPTDRRTDTTSYRDATAHLKKVFPHEMKASISFSFDPFPLPQLFAKISTPDIPVQGPWAEVRVVEGKEYQPFQLTTAERRLLREKVRGCSGRR